MPPANEMRRVFPIRHSSGTEHRMEVEGEPLPEEETSEGKLLGIILKELAATPGVRISLPVPSDGNIGGRNERSVIVRATENTWSREMRRKWKAQQQKQAQQPTSAEGLVVHAHRSHVEFWPAARIGRENKRRFCA